MSPASFFHPLLWLLAAIGVVAILLVAALATPLTDPPPLMSIQTGARAVGSEGRPDLSRFQARDGTWLAYRRYPGAEGDDRLVILAHGSSASSDAMHALAGRSPPRAPRRWPSMCADTAPRARAATSPISASSTTTSPISSPISARRGRPPG